MSKKRNVNTELFWAVLVAHQVPDNWTQHAKVHSHLVGEWRVHLLVHLFDRIEIEIQSYVWLCDLPMTGSLRAVSRLQWVASGC